MKSESAQTLMARASRAWSSLSNTCDDLAEIGFLDLDSVAVAREALSVVEKVIGVRKIPRWGEEPLPFLGKKRGGRRSARPVDQEQGESDLSDWPGMLERKRTDTPAAYEKRRAKQIVRLLDTRPGPWSIDQICAAIGGKATKQMVLAWLGVAKRRGWIRASGRGSTKRWSGLCHEGTVVDIRRPPPPFSGSIVSVLLEGGAFVEKRLRAGRLLESLSVGRRVLVRACWRPGSGKEVVEVTKILRLVDAPTVVSGGLATEGQISESAP